MTCNYDTLLERSFPGADVLTTEDAERVLDSLSRRDRFVLKLYGRLDQPATLVRSYSHFQQLRTERVDVAQALEGILSSWTVLFLGAGMGEITDLLQTLRAQTPNRRHYAVMHVDQPTWRVQAEQLLRRFGGAGPPLQRAAPRAARRLRRPPQSPGHPLHRTVGRRAAREPDQADPREHRPVRPDGDRPEPPLERHPGRQRCRQVERPEGHRLRVRGRGRGTGPRRAPPASGGASRVDQDRYQHGPVLRHRAGPDHLGSPGPARTGGEAGGGEPVGHRPAVAAGHELAPGVVPDRVGDAPAAESFGPVAPAQRRPGPAHRRGKAAHH